MDIEAKAKADLWERYKRQEKKDTRKVPNYLLSKLNDSQVVIPCRTTNDKDKVF